MCHLILTFSSISDSVFVRMGNGGEVEVVGGGEEGAAERLGERSVKLICLSVCLSLGLSVCLSFCLNVKRLSYEPIRI